MKEYQPVVYIMANRYRGTIYTGVTNNILKRVFQHKQNEIEGFTKKYCCHYLVFYEFHEKMSFAIEREKQIKAGSRKKNNLN